MAEDNAEWTKLQNNMQMSVTKNVLQICTKNAQKT